MILLRRRMVRTFLCRKKLCLIGSLILLIFLIVFFYTHVSYCPQPKTKTYHINGIAFDYYSIGELTGPGRQWHTFPLPNEEIPDNAWKPNENARTFPISVESNQTVSGLAFIDKIYVLTDPGLVDRHASTKKAFTRQHIPLQSINWRLKWNRTTCNSQENRQEVYRKLNLRPDQPLGGDIAERQCALAMKHVDIWYEMAAVETNPPIRLALILEDDVLFVPFFKEKFNRFIYTALRTGALHWTCATPNSQNSNDDDTWINQDPMFVIGGCLDYHAAEFNKSYIQAQPILTVHKQNAARCSHAYLLSRCSAQALIKQISTKNNIFEPSDDLLISLFRPATTTLQSFWLDPPLVYQGNQIEDLENVPTFRQQTYLAKRIDRLHWSQRICIIRQ